MSLLNRLVLIGLLLIVMVSCQRTETVFPTAQAPTGTPTRTITPTPPWLARVQKRATRTAIVLTQSAIATQPGSPNPATDAAVTPGFQPSTEQTQVALLPFVPGIEPSASPPGSETPTSLLVEQSPTAISAQETITPNLPQSGQGLVGIWQQDHTGWVFQFNPDGTYRLADSYSDLVVLPRDQGNYTFQNDQVTFTSNVNSETCRSRTGLYRVQTPVLGQRAFTALQEACLERDKTMRKGDFYWLPIQPGAQPASASAVETAATVIPLFGSLASPQAKISGMAWYQDVLVFLPSDPTFTGNGQSYLYAVRRQDILDYLSGVNNIGLNPFPILFNDGGLSRQIGGFKAYRAIAFLDDRIFLVAQTVSPSGSNSLLVAGRITSDITSVTLNPSLVVEIPPQSGSGGSRYQALLAWDNQLLVLPELNGFGLNPTPLIQRYDVSLNNLGVYSFPNIEYALTGASEADGSGVFWIVNRYAPGDPAGFTGIDPLAGQYGEGLTHAAFDYVERLVAFQVSAAGFSRLNIPPMQLELWARGARNWQAAARLGSEDLLIATDQYPETILAYLSLAR